MYYVCILYSSSILFVDNVFEYDYIVYFIYVYKYKCKLYVVINF